MSATSRAGSDGAGRIGARGPGPRGPGARRLGTDRGEPPPLSWWRGHAVLGVVLLVGVVRSVLAPPAGPAAVAAVALGAGAAVAVYALLVRWAVWRPMAALAVLPAVWGAHRAVDGGLPGTMAVLAVAAALLVVGWRAPLTPGRALAGGALVVAAVVVPAQGGPVEAVAVLPLPLLGLCVVLALAAAAGAGRARGSGLRLACLLVVAAPLVVQAVAATTGPVPWAEQHPALVLVPAAGALGLTALLRGRRGAAASRSQVDDVDRAATEDFRRRYGEVSLAPVAVVIAAYNEATGLPLVLSALPAQVCGLDVDVVVVDDGSTDGTAEVLREAGGVHAMFCAANRGQGAALRLGYRVAAAHGARYVVTTDADAQYDPADMPRVLAPVLAGEADLVTGSRRLGQQATDDRFRRLGVHVFAWAVAALTGQRLTDTSFGLRAMRADLTSVVTLNEPQYQSSELLLGAISHGYRILEVPGTMNVRAAGTTKKGGNLIYGTRYARVVLATWWREGCPAPAGERAQALARGRRPVSAGP